MPLPTTARLKSCSEADVKSARLLIEKFAGKHHLTEYLSVLDSAEVVEFISQEALCDYLKSQNQLQEPLPSGLVATTYKNKILQVNPDEAMKIRPEFGAMGQHRIIAHEMAHLIHEAAVEGHDDAMGPEWFYEGVACLAAGQHFDISYNTLTPPEVLDAVQGNDRRRYGRYEAAVRYFSELLPLPALIKHASRPDFEDWLSAGKFD